MSPSTPGSTADRRIGIAGHRGLPPRTTELVRAGLHDILSSCSPGIVGVTCLADGADQLFARAVLSLGGRLEVVVPAERYLEGLPPDAQDGYGELMSVATHVERLPFVESTERAHMAGGQAVVDRSDLLVAVWDGAPARGLGGTADIVAYARERGVPVEVVWPHGASRD